MEKKTILIIDDNEDILFSLKMLLKRKYRVILEKNPKNIEKLFSENEIHLTLLDMNFLEDSSSGEEGFRYLKEILKINSEAVVIFITAYGGVERAVEALKAGAFNFIVKPWKNEKLLGTISSALKLRSTQDENKRLKLEQNQLKSELNANYTNMFGNSSVMKDVFDKIEKVAKTNANVLILGENGTGKELVAREIHKSSLRNNELLVKVDLGSLNENLFESELFGHEKGAFTDAKKQKIGRLKVADGGTLFLDEIGNLSLNCQIKFLSALENREVTPIGSNTKQKIDIRLISATNSDLHKLASKKEFRQDLLYRINTIEVNLPPLRDRGDDIELLALHFLRKYSHKYKKNIKEISGDGVASLNNYSWPGNIRELQHTIERAVILTDNSKLQAEDFDLNKKSHTNEFQFKSYNLEEIEKEVITKILKKFKGNISKASKELGLSRAALYRRMEKYEL